MLLDIKWLQNGVSHFFYLQAKTMIWFKVDKLFFGQGIGMKYKTLLEIIEICTNSTYMF